MELRRSAIWVALSLVMVLASFEATSGRIVAIVNAQASVTVSLDPSTSSVSLGKEFTVDVTVAEDAADLYGAQFQLIFDPGPSR